MSILTNVELVFWNLDRGAPPTVALVREALSANGLNPERAVDIPDSTAFRRACDAQKRKEESVKVFVRKSDGLVCAQFDIESQQEGELRRNLKAQYLLLSDGSLKLQRGPAIPEMDEDYETARRTYAWSDVSKVIQAVLTNDGLGAYSPRKGGGVYFVPLKPDALNLLDKLTTFATSLGVRMLRYQVPDLTSQREEIADAIALSYSADMDAHDLAISAYTDTTKGGILDNRREAIAATAQSMVRVKELMNGRYQGLVERVERAQQSLLAAQARIDAHAQVQQQQTRLAGRRQIAGLFPETEAS